MHLKTKPHLYQEECVQEINDLRGRALVAMEQGLGKSITSLLYFYEHRKSIDTALVICPASVKWVWEQEAKKHFNLRADVLQSRKARRSKLKPTTKLFIINYDILKGWLPYLIEVAPQLIIGDEIHYLRGLSTQRTEAFKFMCQGIPHILALSGTPIVNNPAELWPILNILRPDKWSNFAAYAHRHCSPRLVHGVWKFTGVSNVKELNKDLRRYVLVRRRSKDVLKELPPKSRFIIPLDIDNRSEYNRAVKDFLNWLWEKSPSRAARAARAEEKVKIGYLLRLASTGKMPGALEWIDNYLSEEGKLLVFGIHKKILSMLEDKYGKECVKVDGSIIGDKREMAFQQFNEVKRTKILVGNIDAAGVGWSCTCTSDTAVLEAPWSPGKLDQALSRTHGLNRGIEGKVSRGWLFVAKDTIEEKLFEILQRKQRAITSALDGERVENEMSVFDELIKALEESENTNNTKI